VKLSVGDVLGMFCFILFYFLLDSVDYVRLSSSLPYTNMKNSQNKNITFIVFLNKFIPNIVIIIINREER